MARSPVINNPEEVARRIVRAFMYLVGLLTGYFLFH